MRYGLEISAAGLSMKPRVTYVVFDSADPGSLAAFWMEALGYDEEVRGAAAP
jgi:hypothetical protein